MITNIFTIHSIVKLYFSCLFLLESNAFIWIYNTSFIFFYIINVKMMFSLLCNFRILHFNISHLFSLSLQAQQNE